MRTILVVPTTLTTVFVLSLLYAPAALFVVTLAHHFAFFTFIRCPHCGLNPTRTKQGKKMNVKTVWRRLERYESCPRCGRQGPAGGA